MKFAFKHFNIWWEMKHNNSTFNSSKEPLHKSPLNLRLSHISLNISHQCPYSPPQQRHWPHHQHSNLGTFSMYDRTIFSISVTMLSDCPSEVHAPYFIRSIQIKKPNFHTRSLNCIPPSPGTTYTKLKCAMQGSRCLIQTNLESTRMKLSDAIPNTKYQNHITYPRRSWSNPGDRSSQVDHCKTTL